ncbi:hypothetical protein NDU88_003088 [Pleurodeles waltl]|uniref:Uncharacterized protein n=1 Tax=Pleurodeles waltl TaxID=8319 RepID=A0AAV7LFP0_PLEWA|nr:hypothetical protein NDU88_003088 [Pleurodeles waltl]
MFEPDIVEGSAQSAVRAADQHFQDGSTGATSSSSPTSVLLDNLPPAHSTISSQYKGKSLVKLAYPLFSNLTSNAKEPPKATAGGSSKEGGPERTILPEEEIVTNITVPPSNAAVVVSSGLRISNPTSENLATNTMPSTSSSLENPFITVNTEGTTNITAKMEVLMGQILVELQATKVSQEETRRETKDQLNQLNTHLTLLSTRVSQVEQRVSDLEDSKNQVETTTSRVQSEVEDLQIKLDKMENRSRRSNLRFVGVPEEMEAGSSVIKVVSALGDGTAPKAEPRRKQKRLAPEAPTQSNSEKRRRIETHRNRRRRTPEETRWVAAGGRWQPRPHGLGSRLLVHGTSHGEKSREGLWDSHPPETLKITPAA